MEGSVAQPISSPTGKFAAAAQAAARRLLWVRWLAALRASGAWVGAGIAVWIAARLGWVLYLKAQIAAGEIVAPAAAAFASVFLNGWAVALGVAAWLGIAWWRANRRLPRGFDALAAWDRAAGRKDAFASAQFFEARQGADLTPGERLHLSASEAALGSALPQMPRDLPPPRFRWWQWLAPAAAAIAVGFGTAFVPVPVPLGEGEMTSDQLAAADEEADKLAKEGDKLKDMEGLTDEEKDKMDQLKEALAAAAEELKDSEGKSAKEVLDELEKRAREAEKLARELGDDTTGWASEEMIAEMRGNADTADMADAIADKDPGRTADEAAKVAESLKNDALTNEAKERLDASIGNASEKRQEADMEKPVGRHVGAAADEMKADDPKAAGREFDRLADHFRRLEQREKAQEELEKLAEALRDSGANIAGQGTEGMQKLANQDAGQPQQLMPNNPALQPLGAPMNMQNIPMGNAPLAPPGMMQPGMGQMQPGQMMAPVPGQGMQPGQGMALVPGQGNKPGQGMMIAPIPGTAPGAGAGAAAVPGAAPGGNSPGQGGLQAGNGSAQLGNAQTKPNASAQQGNVAAAINQDGQSMMRAVEGGTREENAQMQRRAVAAEFLKVEEEALDEKALPLSRRGHVLRYFTTLREQFEASEQGSEE